MDVTPGAYLSLVTSLLEQTALQEISSFVNDVLFLHHKEDLSQAAALVRALGRNTTVQRMLLNLLHADTALRVQTYCRLNRAGRSVLFAGAAKQTFYYQ